MNGEQEITLLPCPVGWGVGAREGANGCAMVSDVSEEKRLTGCENRKHMAIWKSVQLSCKGAAWVETRLGGRQASWIRALSLCQSPRLLQTWPVKAGVHQATGQ